MARGAKGLICGNNARIELDKSNGNGIEDDEDPTPTRSLNTQGKMVNPAEDDMSIGGIAP